jgi:MinD-like ATPase involved in chromosome partitioning or flagellar assembly
MLNIFRRKPDQRDKLIVLLASRDPDPKLVEVLAGRPEIILRETFTTRGVIRGLPDADLVILGDVIPLWDVDVSLMQHTLESTKIPVAAPEGMLAKPEEWIATARLANRKKLQYLPSRFVLVTGWAGGVGKSTIALAIAKRFRERNLPTAILEANEGGSYLVSRLGPQLHSLYDVITGEGDASEWEGIKLHPIDYRASQVLSDDARMPDFLAGLKKGYTLVVVDASPNHPFWPRLLDLATTILIITAPREDSLFQAETLLKELQPVRAARPDLHVHLIMNMVRTLGERIGVSGMVAATIPFDERMATRLAPRIADPILNLLYPGWVGGANLKAAKKRQPVEKQETKSSGKTGRKWLPFGKKG